MFARTERLLLRPGWPEDAPALARGLGDEAIVRNLASVPWPYGLAEAEAFLASPRARNELSLLVFRRTHGAPQLIGSAGVNRHDDGSSELGYWISRRHWGLGYATEAAGAVVDIARHALRVKQIGAGHFLDNPASGRVLEKLGFRPTGEILPRHSAGRGTTALSKLYCLRLSEDGTCGDWPILKEPIAA